MNKKYGSKHGSIEGIELKKHYGQHFLKDESIIEEMIDQVELTSETSVFEIGCGAGILTKNILETQIERLWVFEIDVEWAHYVQDKYPDPRLKIYTDNFLDIDFSIFDQYKPWTLLANLPYAVTFPILHKLQENRHILKEGVIMIQEEVAQKIVQTSGRGYGYQSIFLQHYFNWKLLSKVSPNAFYPPPKVDSRLLYFEPKKTVKEINNEPEFWKFIKRAFTKPRKTLKNNLQHYHYDLNKLSPDILQLRAQQLSQDELIKIWDNLLK